MFQTKATNVTLTPEVTEYLARRLSGLWKLFPPADPTLRVSVELGRTTRHHESGDVFRSEINLSAGGESFRAVAEGPDLLSAIDRMKDEIEREVTKQKARKRSLFRRGGAEIKRFLKGLYKKR